MRFYGPILALCLAASPVLAAVPKVPGVVKTNSCDPFVVEIELPPNSVMGWAPGFAPEAAFVDEMKPLRKDTARLIVLAKQKGVFRVILWLKGETDYIVLVIDASDIPAPKEPDPKPKDPPTAPKSDPIGATGRLRFGSAGCTATVIGPKRQDGRYDVLTAAHCNGGKGDRGTLTLKNGITVGVTVVAKNERADLCWMVTDTVVGDLPFAVIATANPAVGTAIWHMGYGVDVPGNREDGEVLGETTDGQLQMKLSVSSGDSGSGIFRADTGELVAVVCCTTGRGTKTIMYGGCAVEARKLRPATTDLEAWVPKEMPPIKFH